MRHRWLLAAAVGAAVALTAAVGLSAADTAAHADEPADLGPGLVTVPVDIHYSKFSISTLHVRAGTTVRFVIHNHDPIDHEFIVGDAAVHLRHERGTEAVHPPVPGEVSLQPLDDGETFFRFTTPGRYLFACHLPGHLAYGMRGWVVVDPTGARARGT